MGDNLLSVSSAFGGAYQEFYSAQDELPSFISLQLQNSEGIGYQR